ncbi:Dopamine receptor 2 [Clonorchis sinensis]|uniref:Dopamine receptor 2 n=1 Tax=Clonorchis sinensis TaxID=79923 RepID=A0A3R7EY26_CLOSI|nr:Dopamine receptor 2 [Clonorchis sinensis]
MNPLLELGLTHKIVVAVLSVLTSVTIGGNLLVMLAILLEPRLRQSVTNCFIFSLAAADLLLGTVVMPFSIVEYWRQRYVDDYTQNMNHDSTFELWPYGQGWCDTWHAFDVLSCTASILNLCVISVERYIAVSDPVSYQTRVTHSRSIIMIASAWICSALISFPAIVWWRASLSGRAKPTNGPLNSTAAELKSFSTVSTTDCVFPDNQLYLFLSSCVSFHIPLVVMIVVYWRIYKSATKVLKSLERGVKILNNGDLIIRVHRGGSCKPVKKPTTSMWLSSVAAQTSSGEATEPRAVGSNSYSDVCSSDRAACEEIALASPQIRTDSCERPVSVMKHVRFAKLKNSNHKLEKRSGCRCDCQTCCGCASFVFRCRGRLDPQDCSEDEILQNDRRPRLFSFKKRINRFLQEKRAAKTLGIIMGVFIVCWLPFFVYNTLKSIQPSWTQSHESILFPFLTWLGYVNSSINPFIYAYSLRDVRRGFNHLFCLLRRKTWNHASHSSESKK